MTMRGGFRWALFVWALAVFPAGATAENVPKGTDSPEATRNVLDVFRKRASLIATIGFRFRYLQKSEEWFKARVPNSEVDYVARFKIKSRMQTFERLGKDGKIDREYSFDGKKSYLMDRLKQQDSLVIQNGMAGQIYGILSPMAFLTEDTNHIPLTYFIERAKSCKVEDGLIRLDGDCDDDGLITGTYWFDPSRGHAVTKFRIAVKGDTRFQGTVQEWDVANVGGQVIHVPKVMSVSAYEDGKVKYTGRILVERYAINEPYSDESFVPNVDKKRRTGVWDRNLMMGYALGNR
jgi:hypothetical protein